MLQQKKGNLKGEGINAPFLPRCGNLNCTYYGNLPQPQFVNSDCCSPQGCQSPRGCRSPRGEVCVCGAHAIAIAIVCRSIKQQCWSKKCCLLQHCPAAKFQNEVPGKTYDYTLPFKSTKLDYFQRDCFTASCSHFSSL